MAFGREGTVSGETLWALKTPVFAAGAVGGFEFLIRTLTASPWAQENVAAAHAVDEAYQTELLRAYQFTYPNDMNVTAKELSEFEQVVFTLDDSFRYSNFKYQDHVYEKMMELYGSPQGDLTTLAEEASQVSAAEMLGGALVLGEGVAALIAAISLIGLPFAVKNRRQYGRGW